MRFAPILAVAAIATAAHAADAPPRFPIDDGRASVVFPRGAPMKMTMTQETLPGVAPGGGALSGFLPAQSWIVNDRGQTFMVMATQRRRSPIPGGPSCPPPRIRATEAATSTMSCRLITEAGETVIENRTARSDGGVMVMRTFQGGERTYLLSYMRVGDKLLAEFAKHRSGPEPSAADGDAFLDSFQLGSGGSH